ncbi:MAG: amino acid adenylation domain-containing protein [Gammaproteobacteria bacterium]|nr:amino acid adenylation domain-containing protein [Gammaproteobacteria bacterium]
MKLSSQVVTQAAPITITVDLKNHITTTVDIEFLVNQLRMDIIKALESGNDFVRTYTFGKVVKPTLIISSTFSANSVIAPLTHLLKEFSDADAVVTYQDFTEQLLNPSSQFHNNKRGINVLLFRFGDLCNSNDGIEAFQKNLDNLTKQITQYNSTTEAPLILCSCAQQTVSKWQAIEEAFLENIIEKRMAYVIRDRDIQSYYPIPDPHNEYGEKEAHLPYTVEYFNVLGIMIARMYYSLSTSPKKVIVLDCDDTLWKGKVGDDGVQGIVIDEQRKIFQKFLVEKFEQGFLLCLCSRNVEDDVWAVFDQRSDMILQRNHIADWRINWEEKSKNVTALSRSLNLALDSFIFFDDDPAQIGEVQIGCPEVLCLQIPKQDELISTFIHSVWGLEGFGKHFNGINDTRTKHYQNNAMRNTLKQKATTFDEYLNQLKLQTNIRSIEESDYPRVTELMQRSNQFNFNKWSPEECTEVRLRNLINTQGYKCLVVDVNDTYDNYGLVGLMLYHYSNGFLLVEAFVISCRALGKGVEHEMLKEFSKILVTSNQKQVYILFKATQKNAPASKFLTEIGFKLEKSEGNETIHSIPIEVAATASPRWEKAEESQPQESITVNETIINQNDFVKQIVASTIHYQAANETPAPAPLPLLNSIESTIEYIQKLIGYLGCTVDGDLSLIQLGFDSTLAVHFASQVYKGLNIHLSYTDILNPNCTVNELAKIIYGKISNRKNIPILPRNNNNDPAPLSREQQRLWSFYNQHPDSSKYNISINYQLKGDLNLESLQAAFRSLLQKETIFCTTFQGDLHHATQHVDLKKISDFQLDIQEGNNLTQPELEEKVQHFIDKPFNLERDLLLRAQIYHTEDRYILSICVPHIIHDAVSLNLLMRCIAKYYSAFCRKENFIDENNYQYNDYVQWQQSEPSEVMQSHQTYWQNQLAGKSNSNLPIMKKTTPSQKSRRISFSFEETMTKNIEQIATQSQATLYHVLVALFSALLSKYTGQLDTLILTPTSGRQHPDTNQMIGFFVNLIMLNTRIKPENNFFQSVTETQRVILDSLEHQDYPFIDQLSSLENPESELPISFVFQNYDVASLDLPNIESSRIFADNNSILYDTASETRLGPLAMYMGKEGNQLGGLIEYDEALFTEEVIHQFIMHFQTFVSNVIADPNKPILNHSLLSASESEQILHHWNRSNDKIQNFDDILSTFQSQVGQNPDRIAIVSRDKKVSYGELDRRSTQLCSYLKQKLTLASEDRIAICLPRGADEAIAILAILKAGCVYVPINPKDPFARISFILEDTKSKAVLLTEKLTGLDVFQQNEIEKIIVDHIALPDMPTLEVTCSPKPTQLAYIMYTSGSTGRPKGVLVEHQSIARLVIEPGYIEFSSKDKIAQFSNPSFDAATFELWGGLLNGATLIYPDPDILLNLDGFSQFLTQNEITILFITSALFEEFAFLKPAIFKNLTYLLTGGDTLNPKAVAAILNCSEGRPKHVLNCYGPTENTTFSTTYEINDFNQNEVIPIGTPVQATEVYVLDAQQQPVPIGVPGFLYVGGLGLARGYLNQQELTNSKFKEISISNVKKRLYHTGDLVQWQPGGTISYIGRVDNQVKLRGYRVDIGEIEQRLLAYPAIKQAIVVVQTGESSTQKKLIAYFVPSDPDLELNSIELGDFLKQGLPYYMLPTALIQKRELPITLNGKIDRVEMAKLKLDIDAINIKYKPNTETEKLLMNFIIDAMGLSRDVTIDFTNELSNIGFNSINLMQLTHKIKENFGVQLSASTIWGMSNIQQIATLIDEKRRESQVSTVANSNKDCLVEIQAGDSKKFPIIFIHPAGGTTHCYKELMVKLDKDQPCYVIEDASLMGREILWASIPQIATSYLQLIKQLKPDWNQIILSGWSFGGMVAAEMALQNNLNKNTKIHVRSLMLLDTWVVSQLAPATKNNLKQKVINQYYNNYKDQVEQFVMDIFKTRQEQGFSYKPSQVITTPILLFKARDSNSIIDMVDPMNYWREFSKNVQVRQVNGDHDTMLNGEYAEELATEISKTIKILNLLPSSPKSSSFWNAPDRQQNTMLNQRNDFSQRPVSDNNNSC